MKQRVSLQQTEVQSAARAGLAMLDLDTTLIPGSMRKEISKLETVMIVLATGDAVLAQPAAGRVESKP